jgi:hypothetical protein
MLRRPLYTSALLAVLPVVVFVGVGWSVPAQITYQGSLSVGGSPYSGVASMKFAILTAGTSVWSNDSTSVNGSEPVGSVTVLVSNGVFTVHLGSAPMKPLTTSALAGVSSGLLRVWASTGGPFEQLAPDQALSSAPFALQAGAAATGNGPWNESAGNVFRETGNVGIGTNDPDARIDVEQTSETAYAGRFNNDGGDGPGVRIEAAYKDSNVNPLLWIGDRTGAFPLMQVKQGDGPNLTLERSPGNVNFLLQGSGSQFDQSIRFKDEGSDWFVGNKWNGEEPNGFGIGRTAVKEDFVLTSQGQCGIRGSIELGPAGQTGPATPFIDFRRGVVAGEDHSARIILGNDQELDVVGRGGAGSVLFFVDGRTATHVLDILGGSDFAEPFNIAEAADGSRADEGMVVTIDPERPGELRVADEPYDSRVAGVISGANGVAPGLVMRAAGKEGTDGSQPVALSGRVWCWVDASYGSVRPGDLLTTSSTPGMAMRASDPERRSGATIGKAMTSLEKGRGLVLVLVSLQ